MYPSPEYKEHWLHTMLSKFCRFNVFCGITFLRNFAKFPGKRLPHSPLFNKVVGLRLQLYHKGISELLFCVNFSKIFRTVLLQNTFGPFPLCIERKSENLNQYQFRNSVLHLINSRNAFWSSIGEMTDFTVLCEISNLKEPTLDVFTPIWHINWFYFKYGHYLRSIILSFWIGREKHLNLLF